MFLILCQFTLTDVRQTVVLIMLREVEAHLFTVIAVIRIIQRFFTLIAFLPFNNFKVPKMVLPNFASILDAKV